MIKESTRKIYFTEYFPVKGRVKDESKPPFVRVNTKAGVMVVGRKALDILGIEGQFVKFFYDQGKKIIGWKVRDKLENGEVFSKSWKLVKANKSTGNYIVSVAGMLTHFKGLEDTSYRCEVKKYREVSSIMDKGEVYYFIKLDRRQNDDDTDS